jgi:hypothetical protein
MACSSRPSVSTRICRFLPLISLPASKPCGSMQAPLVWGLFCQAVSERASFFLDRFLCSTWSPVSSPRPAVLQSRRAQELSRLAVAPNLAAYSALARPHLDCSEHDGTLGAVGMTIRGEPAFPGADQSRHDLVSGGSTTRTMMHSCASAAKLRGGGPILFPGVKAKGGDRDPATSNRHRYPLALEAGRAETVERFLCNSAHKAGRRTTPSGIAPSRTSRHRAISSLRASATIIVLRVCGAFFVRA